MAAALGPPGLRGAPGGGGTSTGHGLSSAAPSLEQIRALTELADLEATYGRLCEEEVRLLRGLPCA